MSVLIWLTKMKGVQRRCAVKRREENTFILLI
ncbi:hypothetical protein EPIR_2547 [Erwinia piriflorinigrans CFBP 5888]|uniref:Uncharacterized protein n=1 Tax=Erwinia piriflorinigrans CFBP 5888 TaxID=1161919 RepID=V5ZAF5_9GAMM|nr:hypothetical protein EPIR_2547 [Erwinia piriflorinigrans CFBP 5888]